jgi:hypothetical protein
VIAGLRDLGQSLDALEEAGILEAFEAAERAVRRRLEIATE